MGWLWLALCYYGGDVIAVDATAVPVAYLDLK